MRRTLRAIILRTGIVYIARLAFRVRNGRKPTASGPLPMRENPKLLPGARRVLETLERDFALGIVTSGDRRRVRRQLRDFQLAHYFSACVCSQDTLKKKPHPAPLELALRRLRAHPDECIFVGDAPEDVEMARRAGVHSVGVLGPFATAKRIRAAQPNALLSSIRELPRYFRALTK